MSRHLFIAIPDVSGYFFVGIDGPVHDELVRCENAKAFSIRSLETGTAENTTTTAAGVRITGTDHWN